MTNNQLREALEEQRLWHDSRRDDLSKQPPSNDRDWRRMEHAEQIEAIDQALSTPQPTAEVSSTAEEIASRLNEECNSRQAMVSGTMTWVWDGEKSVEIIQSALDAHALAAGEKVRESSRKLMLKRSQLHRSQEAHHLEMGDSESAAAASRSARGYEKAEEFISALDVAAIVKGE